MISNGTKRRFIKSIRIHRKFTFIEIDVPRLLCKDCGSSLMMHLPFSGKNKSYSRALAAQALDLSKKMTMKDVCDYLNLDWRALKEIQKASLKKKYGQPELSNLTSIGIDEICIGKGHNYMTIVMDLISGSVVFMAEGKSSESLLPFWKRLKRNKVSIKAVAIDMGRAYISAVKKCLPNAILVFDHFHVIKLVNEKLSNLRRILFNSLENSLEKEVLKRSRWLLLKNPDNLLDKRNEKKRLQKALELNEPLSIAYYLKEDLRELWKQGNKKKASLFLEQWATKAEASGIPIFQKLAHRLLGYRNGLLAYYDYQISTGPLEATNNKIKNIQRAAYGFRDKEFFKLKVYASHDMSMKLIG